MGYNCDCIYHRNISGCTNKKVQYSFFGYGPRLCTNILDPKECKHSKSHSSIKPPPAPPPPPPKKYNKCCCNTRGGHQPIGVNIGKGTPPRSL
jgi:hypothetical protein